MAQDSQTQTDGKKGMGCGPAAVLGGGAVAVGVGVSHLDDLLVGLANSPVVHRAHDIVSAWGHNGYDIANYVTTHGVEAGVMAAVVAGAVYLGIKVGQEKQ